MTDPGIADDLLWCMAIDHPEQVLSNPRFRQLQSDRKHWWTYCGTDALLTLLATSRDIGPIAAKEYLLESLSNALTQACSLQGHAVNYQVVDIDALVPDPAVNDGQDSSSPQGGVMRAVTLRFTAPWCEAAIELSSDHGPSTSHELLNVLQALGIDDAGIIDAELLESFGWSIDEIDNDGGPMPGNLELESPNLAPGWQAVLSNWSLATGDCQIAITSPDGSMITITLQESEGDVEFYNEMRDLRLARDIRAVLFPGLASGVRVILLLRKALGVRHG